MRLLILKHFTNEGSTELNPAGQLALVFPPSPSPLAFSRNIRHSGEKNFVERNYAPIQDIPD
jgi:hypothetical protein